MQARLTLVFTSLLTFGIFKNNAVFGRRISKISVLDDVSHLLKPLVTQYNAPALGGLFLDESGTLRIGAAGTRKRWSGVNVTTDDLWHLGSNTKAITATLIARFVEMGRVTWEDTIGKIFDDLNLRREFYSITFLHLLSHSAGIPRETNWTNISESAPTLVEQRVNAVKALNDIVEPIPLPGTVANYSNWGVVVAAAMLERVTGDSYENLLSQHVFGPLGMDTAGYGPTSGSDEVTQPWGHYPFMGTGIPVQIDNLLVMTPAGTVHCSLQDWAKFVLDHLRGELGFQGLLTPQSYRILHTAPFNISSYALGWIYGEEGWAAGPTIWHNGSNGLNFAKMVIDPEGRVASMATCNQGSNTSGDMVDAVDEVLRVMATGIAKYPSLKGVIPLATGV